MRPASFDATIKEIHGGSSSVAERLTVAQDVEGSIPSRRPNFFTDRTRRKAFFPEFP